MYVDSPLSLEKAWLGIEMLASQNDSLPARLRAFTLQKTHSGKTFIWKETLVKAQYVWCCLRQSMSLKAARSAMSHLVKL